MLKCPYNGLPALDAGDGILMCEACNCFGWSPDSLAEYTEVE